MTSVYRHEDPAVLTANRQRFGEHVYTPLEQVVERWRKRRSGLFSAMPSETATGATVPPVLRGAGPVAVLCRQVGTPNYEMRRVVRLCAQHGIRLVVWEFHTDRFVMENRDKYALGRLGFYGGLGRNGGRRLEYVRIFDVDTMNGNAFRDIHTYRGETLIEFHHRLLAAECPELAADALFDGSSWFAAHGGAAKAYYPAFVSLFLRHAILFETFVLQEDNQREFTRDVFLPAFQALYQKTGLKPLVVPAEREDWEGDDFWQLYPEPLRRHLGPYRVRDQVAVDTGLNWETPADREARPTSARRAAALYSGRDAALPQAVGARDY
ncbi:MAG: hypothetical protein IT493_08765 [Gammaproteobacteria bacterium]|nr:hypothetical protein [Gammaproteobacteria bacterium]